MAKKKQQAKEQESEIQSQDASSKKSSSNCSSSFSSKGQIIIKPKRSHKSLKTNHMNKTHQEAMQEQGMMEEKVEDSKSVNSQIESFTPSNSLSAKSDSVSKLKKGFDKMNLDSQSLRSSSNGSYNSFGKRKIAMEKQLLKLRQIQHQTYLMNTRAQYFNHIMDIEQNQENAPSYEYKNTSSNSSESNQQLQNQLLLDAGSSQKYAFDQNNIKGPFLKKTIDKIQRNLVNIDKKSIISQFPLQANRLNNLQPQMEEQNQISDNLSDGGLIRSRPAKKQGPLKRKNKGSHQEQQVINFRDENLQQSYEKVKNYLKTNNKQIWDLIKKTKLKQVLKFFVTSKKLNQQAQFNLPAYQKIKQAVELALYFVQDYEFVEYTHCTCRLILSDNNKPFDQLLDILDEIKEWNTFIFTTIISYCPIETSLLNKFIGIVNTKSQPGENQCFQNLKNIFLVVSPPINRQKSNYPKINLQVLSELRNKIKVLILMGNHIDEIVLQSLLKARLPSLEEIRFQLPQLINIQMMRRILQQKHKCFPKARITFEYLENYRLNQLKRVQINKLLNDQRWINIKPLINIIPQKNQQEFIVQYVSNRNYHQETFDLTIEDFNQKDQNLDINHFIKSFIDDEQIVEEIEKNINKQLFQYILNLFLNSINQVYQNTMQLKSKYKFVRKIHEPFVKLFAKKQQDIDQVVKLNLKSWCRQLFFQMTLFYDIQKIDYILKHSWNNLEELTLCGIKPDTINLQKQHFEFLVKYKLNQQLTKLVICGQKIDQHMITELLKIKFSKLDLLQILSKKPLEKEVIKVFRQFLIHNPEAYEITIRLPKNADQGFEKEFEEVRQRINFEYDYENIIQYI